MPRSSARFLGIHRRALSGERVPVGAPLPRSPLPDGSSRQLCGPVSQPASLPRIVIGEGGKEGQLRGPRLRDGGQGETDALADAEEVELGDKRVVSGDKLAGGVDAAGSVPWRVGTGHCE